MTDIAGLITIGVSALAATNIDDIFVLDIFFFVDISGPTTDIWSVYRNRITFSNSVLSILLRTRRKS